MTHYDSSPRIPAHARVADGWNVSTVTGPSRLYGANGIRGGQDGRLYVAQVAGSQISAIDPDSGRIEIISATNDPITAPDDLAFDGDGNMFATELTLGLVSMRSADGRYRIIADQMPCSNPITYHQGRLFAGECRPDGRIMQMSLDGGPHRVLLENVPSPNAFEFGPDGKLYFPVMGANAIWRIDPTGGEPEVVATDLGVPDSVKFDAQGFIISTQVASGQVLRINPQDGSRTVLAQLEAGLDNCAFVGDRLFVSNINGRVCEIMRDGSARDLCPEGLQWPMGLAVNTRDTLYIADGAFAYTWSRGAQRALAGMLFYPGYPGFNRGVAATADGQWIISTANGDIARFNPASMESTFLAQGYDQPMDVAVNADGSVIFAERTTGRIHALNEAGSQCLCDGLEQPVGVCSDPEGNVYVSDAATGRIYAVSAHGKQLLSDEFSQPEGLAWSNGSLYLVDVIQRTVHALDPTTGRQHRIAEGLPVGGPPGEARRQVGAVGALSGPMTCFSGMAAAADGTLYVAGDADGSVLALTPD